MSSHNFYGCTIYFLHIYSRSNSFLCVALLEKSSHQPPLFNVTKFGPQCRNALLMSHATSRLMFLAISDDISHMFKSCYLFFLFWPLRIVSKVGKEIASGKIRAFLKRRKKNDIFTFWPRRRFFFFLFFTKNSGLCRFLVMWTFVTFKKITLGWTLNDRMGIKGFLIASEYSKVLKIALLFEKNIFF